MVDRLQKRQSARLCGVVIGWLRSACRCRARGRERRAAARSTGLTPFDRQLSALPPKADMCSAQADVRFVPIADSCTAANSSFIR